MSSPLTKSPWQQVRSAFNTLHLWLGIGSGVILFVVCLTGTTYTFFTEIEEMRTPHRYKVAVPEGAARLPVDEVVDKIKTQVRGKLLFINIPALPERTYQVSILKETKKSTAKKESTERENNRKAAPKQKESRSPRGTIYFINPYTGAVIDTADNGSPFFLGVFRMHRWLLLDQEIGRPIVGCATLIFVFLIISGLVIWVPRRAKSWKQGLKIKWSGNWKRVNHDLHNALGFYASLLLLVMALTGLTWSFEWYKTGLNKLLGAPGTARSEKPLTSSIPPADSVYGILPVSVYVKQADALLPYEGNLVINLAANDSGTVSLTKTHVGFFAPVAGDKIQFDQYSGRPLKVDVFKNKPFGQRIAGSFRALHVGNVYGMFTKILYFIACLIATSLPVTGTIIWINKLKAKRKRNTGAILSKYRK